MPSPELSRMMARVGSLAQRLDARTVSAPDQDGPGAPAQRTARPPDFRRALAGAAERQLPAAPRSSEDDTTPAPRARLQEAADGPPSSAATAQPAATDLVAMAATQTGKPYGWGAGRTDTSAFDCSGFAAWVYRQAGRELPAFTDAAYDATVSVAAPRPGDLVFFRYDDPRQPGVQYPHVGIFAGDDTMIDAATDGGVQRRPLRAHPVFRRLPDAAAPAAGTDGVDLAALVVSAAQKHRIDPRLVTALVQAESGFNPRAVSPVGAKGLMQLMDGTARSLGVADPFDPRENVDGGLRYLRSMLDRYGGDPRLALAAYNAGPNAVDRFGGIPPYAETQFYVDRVLSEWERGRQAP